MKKLTTITAALLLLISASAFTPSDTEVSVKIRTEFQKNFTAAKDVSWKKTNDIYFATFKINEQALSAAYNEEGELVGATRTITLADLPLSVSLAVKNAYEGYTIDDTVTELVNDGQTKYYLTAENAKYKIDFTASEGSLNIEKKTKKK